MIVQPANKSNYMINRYVSDDDNIIPDYITQEKIEFLIHNNPIILFMKGDRYFPQCGYSRTVVEILNQFNVSYEEIDVMKDDKLREGIKLHSDWPTIPQLYINGEFIGGADIVFELFEKGELREIIEVAAAS
eukprot:CAMPEP_0171472900 /NCGR_PEP_ID=MMETSP0946-20130122/1539_1 /TAXON_ID=109269 /ORGANISM="Vaucheria litorea, Strain CCMP2940" /LENGTH=131 /DNA_ID=CAMNT_0012002597 /DNA_START=100 /DNA_END=495 /DNA_ORIENTATION=+